MTFWSFAASMRATRSRTSRLVSTVVLTRITPALSTVITSGLLSLGGAGSDLSSFGGKFSQNVLVTMGVTIMKMIKTTNTTSTSGVMLIAGSAVLFLPFLPPPPKDTPISVSLCSDAVWLARRLLGNDLEQDTLEADTL